MLEDPDKEHDVGWKEPWPLLVKYTLPVGLVGEELGSVTAAEHEADEPTTTVVGRHEIDSVVEWPLMMLITKDALVLVRVPEVALIGT